MVLELYAFRYLVIDGPILHHAAKESAVKLLGICPFETKANVFHDSFSAHPEKLIDT